MNSFIFFRKANYLVLQVKNFFFQFLKIPEVKLNAIHVVVVIKNGGKNR